MKKYSSYVDLKIPSSTRVLTYENWSPKMRIDFSDPYKEIGRVYKQKQSTLTPKSTKYSGGYIQRKKMQTYKKQDREREKRNNNNVNKNKQQNNIKYIINKQNRNKQNIDSNNHIYNIKMQNKQSDINVQYCKFNTEMSKCMKNNNISLQFKSKLKYLELETNDKGGLAANWKQYKQTKSKKKAGFHQCVAKYDAQPKKTINHSKSQLNIVKQQNVPQIKQLKGYYKSAISRAFNQSTSSIFNELCKNHLLTSIDFLSYIKKNQKIIPNNFIKIYLPFTYKKTIIFDLDQTLIHCNQNLSIPYDVALQICFPSGKTKVGINVRPYAVECLRELSKYFEIIVLTASHECYANVVIDYLDPYKELISYRFYRESCYKTEEGFYVKDLRVFGRDLSSILLVDNAAYSYCFQPENGVPIIPYYNNKQDIQLKQITQYLKQFINIKNMRSKNKNYMKLNQYYKYRSPKQLINSLYF